MKLTNLFFLITITFGLIACGEKTNKEETVDQSEKPSVAELHAYKVFHHARYMVTTVQQAGGTNKLLHTKKLPTEGTDAVVTPALDHLYSKAVIDLTSGPVTVEFPEIKNERYWSIHITDQEHYTIFDEIRPEGKYTFVRIGKNMEVPEGATVIECPEDFPHLFIRIQVKNSDDFKNVFPIQEAIKLTGESKPLNIDNYIEFTLATHDVYPENEGILRTVTDFNEEDYNKVTKYIAEIAPSFPSNMGFFGPIDSNEPGSDDPVFRAAAIFGHLGLPAEHAIYIPYFVGKNDVFNAYSTEPDENDNITITFSVEDPNDGTYWMPVIAGEPYYFVVRYYKPDLNNLPKKPCD